MLRGEGGEGGGGEGGEDRTQPVKQSFISGGAFKIRVLVTGYLGEGLSYSYGTPKLWQFQVLCLRIITTWRLLLMHWKSPQASFIE